MKLPKGFVADVLGLLVVGFIIAVFIKKFYYDGSVIPDACGAIARVS